MRPIRQADRCAGACHFFHCNRMGKIIHPCTAEFLVDSETKQAQVTHFLPELWREGITFVDLSRQRPQSLLRPAMHLRAQRRNVLTQIELHRSAKHLHPHLLNNCSYLTLECSIGQVTFAAVTTRINRQPDRTRGPEPAKYRKKAYLDVVESA